MNKIPLLDIFESEKFKPFIYIFIIGFLLYLPSLFFGFTYLDDNSLILDQRYFLSDIGNIFKIFSIDVFNSPLGSSFYYRPILTLSFLIDYQIGGVSPFIYHFTNICIHIISSYLVFILLTKLNYKKIISFIFSIIFLIHPVLTQAVSWIPGRNDSLLAIFVLACFIFFINYLENYKNKDLFLAILFFALSIFTKESGIFLLPILFLFLLFIYKRDEYKVKEKIFNKLNIKNFYFFIISIIIFFVWYMIRSNVLEGSQAMSLYDISKSIFLNFSAVLLFLGKIFLPFNLSVLPVLADSTFIYGIISSATLILLIIFTKEKRWNIILFGFIWFLAFLLPSFIRPNPNLPVDLIEHRIYIPMIGIFFILLEINFFKNFEINKKRNSIILSIIIIIFSIITVSYSFNFKDKNVFWKNAVKNSESHSFAHKNLGAMMYLDGDMNTAEIEFKKALSLNKNEIMAHNNLGLIYANRGMFKESEEEYKKELEINPNYDNAYFNLGILYFQNDMKIKAVENWEKAININHDNINAINALAIYYYLEEDYEKSIFYIEALVNRGIEPKKELLDLYKKYIYKY